jgi:hypothetical protein
VATSQPSPPILRIMYTLPMRFAEIGNVTNKNRAHRSAPVYGAKLRWSLSVSCLLGSARLLGARLTHDLCLVGDLSFAKRCRVRRAARGLKSDISSTNEYSHCLAETMADFIAHRRARARNIIT